MRELVITAQTRSLGFYGKKTTTANWKVAQAKRKRLNWNISFEFLTKTRGKRSLNSDPKLTLCCVSRASACSIFLGYLNFVCYAECDKIANWQIFMSRYIFLNQVFYIHGKFLYIHVKKIYSLSMRLASYQMSFFLCQFTCTIFIHQEGLETSSGLTSGESGNRPQEKQHGG